MNTTEQQQVLIARWEANVKDAEASYNIAVEALGFHERRDHSLGIEQRRSFIGRINETQDDLERARYYLRRARAGLPV